MSRTAVVIAVVVAAFVGVPIAGVVAASILLAIFGNRNIASPGVTADEAARVVAADDFAPYFQFPGDRSLCEKWRKSDYSDGESLYKYDYDLDNDSGVNAIFSYTASTNVCPVKQMAVNVLDTRVKDAHTLFLNR